jgi:hypothetical protein
LSPSAEVNFSKHSFPSRMFSLHAIPLRGDQTPNPKCKDLNPRGLNPRPPELNLDPKPQQSAQPSTLNAKRSTIAQVHRSGYDIQFLGYHLNEAGFAEYQRVPEFNLFKDDSTKQVMGCSKPSDCNTQPCNLYKNDFDAVIYKSSEITPL